jgi:hypothetical protein
VWVGGGGGEGGGGGGGGWDSVVSIIATRNGLVGSGIESWWVQDFPHTHTQTSPGAYSSSYKWVLGLYWEKSSWGVLLITYPPI